MALPVCHRSAGEHSSLHIQVPGTAAEPGGLPRGPLGRGLPARLILLLELDPLLLVMFPPVHVLW
jgi:hypothetical protein